MTTLEHLSNEVIISILEYLTLEEFIIAFEGLNARFSELIFEHPWIRHQLSIRNMDNDTLRKKLDFLEDYQLISKVSSIYIQPFSIYRSIKTFDQHQWLGNFVHLKALSLNGSTLEEAESLLTSESLTHLPHLTRLQLIFSLVIHGDNYAHRLERLISRILAHRTLRHCILHTPTAADFAEIQSLSFVEHLEIDYCSFQSLYALLEFTPYLRHLTANVACIDLREYAVFSTARSLRSLTLILTTPSFDDLDIFLETCPKLQSLHIVTFSVVESIRHAVTWLTRVNDCLPALTKFKREGNIALADVHEYIEAFRWPNRWHLKARKVPNEESYSRITIINTR